jgi:pantoate--beta-alanine ligase
VILAETRAALRAAVREARRGGRRIGFVPTMGYLHEGHLRLFDRAAAHDAFVVASVFVNPLQFGPSEDLDRYPRDVDRDVALARARGVDVLFMPPVSEMYPSGSSRVFVDAPALGDRLCGAFRPGHFRGVLTVVAKLFHMVEPDVAVFGQKDLQQALLVRRMVADLDFDVDIDVMPTVRERDGLAMSSRNAALSADGRRRAAVLYRALQAAQALFTAGERDRQRVEAEARAVIAAEPAVRLQYLDAVEPDTLETPATLRSGTALAVAAFVETIRLIDNHVLT